jgi:ADP-heptose:LPS heptosyltransferase
MAGIDKVPPPDLSMIEADLSSFDLPERFAILVPGASAHRPEKRWPAESYGELAKRLAAAGLTPVLIGAEAERAAIATIKAACPEAIDLSGRTTFEQIAALGRRAEIAVGNDTGPMHVLATAGCRAVVLFSEASDPALTAPRGRDVTVLQRARLQELSVGEVAAVTPLAA